MSHNQNTSAVVLFLVAGVLILLIAGLPAIKQATGQQDESFEDDDIVDMEGVAQEYPKGFRRGDVVKKQSEDILDLTATMRYDFSGESFERDYTLIGATSLFYRLLGRHLETVTSTYWGSFQDETIGDFSSSSDPAQQMEMMMGTVDEIGDAAGKIGDAVKAKQSMADIQQAMDQFDWDLARKIKQDKVAQIMQGSTELSLLLGFGRSIGDTAAEYIATDLVPRGQMRAVGSSQSVENIDAAFANSPHWADTIAEGVITEDNSQAFSILQQCVTGDTHLPDDLLMDFTPEYQKQAEAEAEKARQSQAQDSVFTKTPDEPTEEERKQSYKVVKKCIMDDTLLSNQWLKGPGQPVEVLDEWSYDRLEACAGSGNMYIVQIWGVN